MLRDQIICPNHYRTLSKLWYTRSSATAERQRVSCTRLSRLAHWSCTSL